MESRLHKSFLRIQVFPDTKFPQTCPDSKFPDTAVYAQSVYTIGFVAACVNGNMNPVLKRPQFCDESENFNVMNLKLLMNPKTLDPL
jgi:hypothetical protein